jgi:hypothetical protein
MNTTVLLSIFLSRALRNDCSVRASRPSAWSAHLATIGRQAGDTVSVRFQQILGRNSHVAFADAGKALDADELVLCASDPHHRGLLFCLQAPIGKEGFGGFLGDPRLNRTAPHSLDLQHLALALLRDVRGETVFTLAQPSRADTLINEPGGL